MLVPSILGAGGAAGRSDHRLPLLPDGEVDEEQFRLALLKSPGDRWGGILPWTAAQSASPGSPSSLMSSEVPFI